jgi:diguanylate cyclase
MTPLDFSHREILARLHDLDKAIGSHAKWLARLNRQLICSGTANTDDLAEDAHIRCPFGAWFYGPGKAHLSAEPSYEAISAVHQSMHGIARFLLTNQAAGRPIMPDDYDALMAVAGRFRQLLRGLEQELMERMGAVDKLTGVWNRQAVHVRLAEEVERLQRTRQPCTLCYVDLDDFARLNEAHGQRVGDAVLQSVTAFLASRLRGYDTIFRIGGEEFLVCLPNTALDQATTLLNRLREELAATPIEAEGTAVRLTASFGVVALDPVFFIEETLEQVERAQLIAKREGGNRVCVWHEGWLEGKDPEAAGQ